MKAVAYAGEGKVRLEERERPELLEPTDAILRVTAAAIETASSLGGQLMLGETLWLGAVATGMLDPVLGEQSLAGDDLRRQAARLSIRGGARIRVADRMALDVGAGVGLVSAYAQQTGGGLSLRDDESGVFFEGLAVLGFEPTPHWLVLGGLSLATLVPFEGTEPAEDPEDLLPTLHGLEAALLLGAGYRFALDR